MISRFNPKGLGTFKYLPIIPEVPLGIATKFGLTVNKPQKCSASFSLKIKEYLQIRESQQMCETAGVDFKLRV
jgi:hypothetical protein